jgi:hypothetical protein
LFVFDVRLGPTLSAYFAHPFTRPFMITDIFIIVWHAVVPSNYLVMI